MKTLMIGLCLGLTSLMYSQNFTNQVNQLALNEVVVSSLKNVHYFNTVNDPNAPSEAKQLEYYVGKYDIKSATFFTKDYVNYEVLFECEYGSVLAYFNADGKLLNSNEEFKGIRIPESVRNSLRDTYPDWKLNTTQYRVNYSLNKDIKRVYVVQLTKGNKKMNLKIDCKGVILNPKNL